MANSNVTLWMKWAADSRFILCNINYQLQTTHSYFKIDSISSISLNRLRFYIGKPQLTCLYWTQPIYSSDVSKNIWHEFGHSWQVNWLCPINKTQPIYLLAVSSSISISNRIWGFKGPSPPVVISLISQFYLIFLFNNGLSLGKARGGVTYLCWTYIEKPWMMIWWWHFWPRL